MGRTSIPAFRGTAVGCLALLLLCGAALAQPFSHVLSFQGRLSATDGKPLPDGDYLVHFAMYGSGAGGVALWTETQTVSHRGGTFTAYLGSVTAFSTDLFAGGDRWLGIRLNGDPEMSDRIKLTPAPWSIHAATADQATSAGSADTLDGLHAGASPLPSILLALDGSGKFPLSVIPQLDHGSLLGLGDNDHPQYLIRGEANSITSTMIVNGTITAADLGLACVTQEKLVAGLSVQHATEADNADKVDNMHAVDFATAGHNHDATYVKQNQADSITSAMIVNGTIAAADLGLGCVTQEKLASGLSVQHATEADNADTVDSKHAGNAAGMVPLSNGTVNSTLNADLLDGFHSTSFVTLGTADSIDSMMLADADGTSGQDTSTGRGVKTGHIQNNAVTNAKIVDGAVTGPKIAIGSLISGNNGTSSLLRVVNTSDTQGSGLYASGAIGLWGGSSSSSGKAVYGWNTGNGYGVYGQTGSGVAVCGSSSSGKGVYGTASSGAAYGVYGENNYWSGIGVYAKNTDLSSPSYALFVEGKSEFTQYACFDQDVGIATSLSWSPLYVVNTGTGGGIAVEAQGGGTAVSALALTHGSIGVAAWGDSNGVEGEGMDNWGGYFHNSNSWPSAPVSTGGVYGASSSSYGMCGRSSNSYGGYFLTNSTSSYGLRVDSASSSDANNALYVKGKATFTGYVTLSGGHGDLAENYNSAEPLEPGDVVVIDPNSDISLRLCRAEYDTSAAGIISTAPSQVLMGQIEDEGAAKLALAGRVLCKVDASFGAIKPGDLLTTSPTPGHAMRVQDRSRATGAIVGKALQSLESGKGVIQVMVMSR